MRQKTKLFCLLFIASLVMNAQQKKYTFSLQEAIQFALDSSYTALNANKEVAKALKQKWETTAIGLPQINGEATYTNQLKQPVSLIPAEITGGPAGTFIPVIFGVEQQTSLTATLSQLIFDGSYLVGLEAASVFVDYTNTQKESQDLKIIEGITNAYGAVLLTQESINVLNRNISNLESNLNETQKIYENGLGEEESVEQLQITLLQVKNQLNNTQRTEDIAVKMLKLALGIPIESELLLTDNLESIATIKATSDTAFKPFNIIGNNNFKLSELLVEQRRLEFKLQKAKRLPSVGAFVNLGTTAFRQGFNFLDSDQRWFASSVLGASVKVPIFTSFKNSASTKKAKLAYQQAQISHTENTERIQLGYKQAKSNYEFAIDNLNTLKQNLALAERIEKKNQIKFNEGLASSFELRQAQTQLYSAQQQYLQAQLKVIKDNATLQSILNVFNL
ncbi:TolC family protein [Aquimarina agarilytica]|uniref:TolC family protein n=1 Tax=Aquimarina agarilytica TaxID=1087449 RepID=UPI0002897893|nr:TolC family protein [Aquimarina agarilytica]